MDDYGRKKAKAVETLFEMMADRGLVQKDGPPDAGDDGEPLFPLFFGSDGPRQCRPCGQRLCEKCCAPLPARCPAGDAKSAGDVHACGAEALERLAGDGGLRAPSCPSCASPSLRVDGELGRDLAVFFAKNPKVGIGLVQDIAARLLAAAKTRCILVVINPVSHKARDAIKNHRTQNVVFELFRLSELQYNVTRHVFVPPHRICTPAEAEKLFKTYGIKPREKFDKMRLIERGDPVMRYYGAVRGQLVEIRKPQHTMPGFYELDYRLVT